MTISISCRGLSKTYSTRTTEVRALEPVDLDVQAGEFLVLIGPSGCGKTTLMRIVGGLQSASEGTLTLTKGRDGRDSIGFVFQQSNLLPWMTVQENAALPLRL